MTLHEPDNGQVFPGPRASRPHLGWHQRGYLPHFDGGAVVQMITFRLADSLPRAAFDKAVASAANEADRRRRLDKTIDDGRGACLLRVPENAVIVKQALQHFDGERYRLIAWVIMPNHVHVVIEQTDGFPLGDVVRDWKSFSAKAINKTRGAKGAVWAADYFDRFIRDGIHFASAVSYVENNPVKAGLCRHSHDWPYSSANESAGGTPAVPGNGS